MDNIHDVIGFDRCANLDCLRELSDDPVMVSTTRHARRFCSVACVSPGEQAWQRTIHSNVLANEEGRPETMEETVRRLHLP
jgi:hypothetical protein